MSRIIETTQTTTKTTFEQSIGADDIRRALNLPSDARVFIRVPRGGDWSGMDLDIEELASGLQVSWAITRTA